MKTIPELISMVRTLEIDHKPDGWPAIVMEDVTALANAVEFLVAACHQAGIVFPPANVIPFPGDFKNEPATKTAQQKFAEASKEMDFQYTEPPKHPSEIFDGYAQSLITGMIGSDQYDLSSSECLERAMELTREAMLLRRVNLEQLKSKPK